MGIGFYIYSSRDRFLQKKIKEVTKNLKALDDAAEVDDRDQRSQKRELEDLKQDSINFGNQYSTQLDTNTSDAKKPWSG